MKDMLAALLKGNDTVSLCIKDVACSTLTIGIFTSNIFIILNFKSF